MDVKRNHTLVVVSAMIVTTLTSVLKTKMTVHIIVTILRDRSLVLVQLASSTKMTMVITVSKLMNANRKTLVTRMPNAPIQLVHTLVPVILAMILSKVQLRLKRVAVISMSVPLALTLAVKMLSALTMMEVSAACVMLDGMVMVISALMMTNVLWANALFTPTALILMDLSTANVNQVSLIVVTMTVTFATISMSVTQLTQHLPMPVLSIRHVKTALVIIPANVILVGQVMLWYSVTILMNVPILLTTTVVLMPDVTTMTVVMNVNVTMVMKVMDKLALTSMNAEQTDIIVT